MAVIVRRHQMAEILPFTVVLHDVTDSVAGVVFLDSLTPVDPRDFVEPVGSVGSPTLAKIDACLRRIYGL